MVVKAWLMALALAGSIGPAAVQSAAAQPAAIDARLPAEMRASGKLVIGTSPAYAEVRQVTINGAPRGP